MSTHLNNPEKQSHDANADPLTGEAGSHPVATGVGAAAAGAAGLAIAAAVAGPVGVVVAAVGGAIIGGYAGKAVGEVIDPTAEEAFWRDEHPRQAFADSNYDDYAPAYRTGYEGYGQYGGGTRTFEEAEKDLEKHYNTDPRKVPWEKARVASQAAWDRVHRGNATKTEGGEPRVGLGDALLNEPAQTGALNSAQMPR